MTENNEIGNVAGINSEIKTKKKSPYANIDKNVLENNKKKIKENIEESFNRPPGFWARNSKTIVVIILCIAFLAMLGYFLAEGGSLWEVIESMLWYFSWPVGVFLLGLLIKKILYL